MKRLFAVITLTGLVLLAGCSGAPPEQPAPTTNTTTQAPAEKEPEVEPVADVVEPQWTQDLWIFNRLIRFNQAGVELDFTEPVISHLEKVKEPDHRVELDEGVFFRVYGKLAPTVTDGDGKERTDVEVLAGLLDFDDETVLAVLATPDADAVLPIGLEDHIEMDLTFMGEYLQPGDPMGFDFTFVQTLPGGDPEGATGLELLSHRFANEQFNFYGTQVDGETELLMFTGAMGVAVEGSTRGQMSGKGKISDPGMKGFRDGVWGARKGGTGGLIGYFRKFGKGAAESNRLLRCNLGGSCRDPIPPPPPPKRCWIRCGQASGDPHLVTFDELRYSPQAVGEFVLVEAEDFTVQMRTAPLRSSRDVSVVTGVAIETDGQTLVLSTGESNGPPVLLINNLLVELTDTPQEITAGSAVVTASSAEVMIETSQEGRVTASMGRSQLSLFVDPGKRDELAGMLGDGDSNPDNDLTTREGEALDKDIARTNTEAFYETYVNSWRITQDESLFFYLPGQDTGTYTDLSFPDTYMNIDSIPKNELKLPRTLCELAGITSPEILENCMFDYWASNDMDFVNAAQQMDLHDGLNTGRYELADVEGGTTEPGAAAGGEDFPDGLGPVEGQTVADYVYVQWNWDPQSVHDVGQQFTHYCPPGGELHSRVWGGDNAEYTADSMACTAAVHAGKITVQNGGIVTGTMVPGRDFYAGAAPRHGVAPQEWPKPWSGGYVLN